MDVVNSAKRVVRPIPQLRMSTRTATLLGIVTGVLAANATALSLLRNEVIAPRLASHINDVMRALQHGSLITAARTVLARRVHAAARAAGG